MYGVRHTFIPLLSYYVIILLCGAMIYRRPIIFMLACSYLHLGLKFILLFVASIASSIKYRGSVDPICVWFAFQKQI